MFCITQQKRFLRDENYNLVVKMILVIENLDYANIFTKYNKLE